MGASACFMPFRAYANDVEIDRQIANVNDSIVISYNDNFTEDPYSKNENIEIIKNNENEYYVTSTVPQEVTIFRKSENNIIAQELIFEEPKIIMKTSTINLNTPVEVSITGTRTTSIANDIDWGTIEREYSNKYILTPSKIGKHSLSICVNGELFSLDILVEKPEIRIEPTRARESAKVTVRGITTEYDVIIEDTNLATFHDEVISCLEPGETTVNFIINGQDIEYPIKIAEHVHQWVKWDWIAPTCTEEGYNLKTCKCGDTEKANISPVTGHSYRHTVKKATCTEEGHEEDTCYKCQFVTNQKTLPVIPHNVSNWEIIEQAIGPFNNGIRCGKCSVCGALMEEEEFTYQQRVLEQKKTRWIKGRLSIPEILVDVAVVESDSQEVCDAQDTACYFWLNGAIVIADHNNQGFDKIKNCTEGMNCYIVTDKTIEKYKCIRVDYGHNNSYDLTENDWGTSVTLKNQGNLIMYTCNDYWQNIIFAVWEKVNTN